MFECCAFFFLIFLVCVLLCFCARDVSWTYLFVFVADMFRVFARFWIDVLCFCCVFVSVMLCALCRYVSCFFVVRFLFVFFVAFLLCVGVCDVLWICSVCFLCFVFLRGFQFFGCLVVF